MKSRVGLVLLVTALVACSANPAQTSALEVDGEESAALVEAGSEESAASTTTTSSAGRAPWRACAATSRRRTPVALHVFPDDGEQPYLDVIESATESLRVFGYMMGYGGILDALRAKAKSGVEVRVILDGEKKRDVNEKYRVMLEGDGAQVVWSDPQFSYMHAKAIVADEERAIVSTGNYSRSYMLKERNFAATIVEPQDVRDMTALFDADWTKAAPPLNCTRLVVSPINARDRLESLIRSAEHELWIESMQLGDWGVREAVADRAAAGVDVRVILAEPSWVSANESAVEFLDDHGIEARTLTAPSVHVKAILVDGKRAYLGSENLSKTSLDRNREIGVVLTDSPSLNRLKSTFESDYAAATPL